MAWTLALAFAGEDPDEAPIPPHVRRTIASTTAAGLAATVLLQALTTIAELGSGMVATAALVLVAGWIVATLAMVGGLG